MALPFVFRAFVNTGVFWLNMYERHQSNIDPVLAGLGVAGLVDAMHLLLASKVILKNSNPPGPE